MVEELLQKSRGYQKYLDSRKDERMKKLALITALCTSLIGLTLPVASQETQPEIPVNASVNADEISSLIDSWNLEVDLLMKAEIAKEIQEKVGVEIDGIIGRKTVAAINSLGVTTEIERLTRAENTNTRLALAVSDGIFTESQAEAIIEGRTQIRAIKDQVKNGELTKQDAKTEIEVVRENMPSKSDIRAVLGSGKKEKRKKR